MDKYRAGWLAELEVSQRERNRGKAEKLGKGEQRGKTLRGEGMKLYSTGLRGRDKGGR